jgi:hypothetical protein
MSVGRLNLPQRLDVIPASEVGELIEQTDREFVQLERLAAEARAEAEEQERLAAAEGVDPKSSSWTMMRLQRFLDGLHEEAGRDASATVEVAQQRARLRLEEARAEADRRGRGLTTDWYPEPPAATTPAAAPGGGSASVLEPPVVVAPPQTRPAPSPPAPPTLAARDNHDGFNAVHLASGSAVVGGVALVTPPTSAPPDPAGPEPATTQSLDDAFWGPDAERAPEPAAAVVAFAPQASPVVAPPAPAPAPAPVAPGQPQVAAPPPTAAAPTPPAKQQPVKRRAKRGVVSRIPFSAVLEVLAVLAILVFILLRLS